MKTTANNTNAPLPEARFVAVVERISAAGHATPGDLAALVTECDRLYELLADAWLTLDVIARLPVLPIRCHEIAADLLRKQGAPGWKGGAL